MTTYDFWSLHSFGAGRFMLKQYILLVGLITLILLLTSGCGESANPEARCLLIGLDGLEMDVMMPLLEKGELPHLKKLIDRGVFGYLRTFEPTLSPVVWTTIATGKNPHEHKVTGFVDPNTNGPFTSNARKGKAVWNIVSDYGLQCNVTGYWITWPAEKINGHMVSQISAQKQVSDIWKGMLYEGRKNATHPEAFIKELWPEVEVFQTAEYIEQEVYPRVYGDTTDLNPSYHVQNLISQSNWSLAGDLVFNESAKYLLANHPADLDIVYLGGTDVIAHRFWCFRDPELYNYEIPIAKRYVDILGDTIDNYYKVADQMVGDLVALVPENTRIMIVSDHGMHADFLDGMDRGKQTTFSAHHLDAPSGIVIAAGEGIRTTGMPASKDDFEVLGTVFDVTPTLLYLLDIPIGRNMKSGKVMKGLVTDALLQSRAIAHIDSHDVDFRPPTSSRSSRKGDKDFIERFEALGYIDGEGKDRVSSDFKMGPKGK